MHEQPTVAATGPADIAVAFSQILRGAGLSVPTSCTHTFAEALCAIGITDRDTTYWAGRATLVRRPEDIDRVRPGIRRVLRAAALGAGRRRPDRDGEHHDRRRHRRRPTTTAGDDQGDASDDVIELRFSSTEVLRHKDFAAYIVRRTDPGPRTRCRICASSARRATRSARARPGASRHGPTSVARCDPRSGPEASRSNVTSREPTPRLRRLVLLLDVSGSMEPYARALLRFVHAAVAGRQKVEAFTMGTRLTRITRELTSRDPDIALRAVGRRVVDWSGGTRLGLGSARVQRRVGRARAGPQLDRRDPVRRVGPRRPRRARANRCSACTG